MKFVMIIWLAVGSHHVERDMTEAQCAKRLDTLRASYSRQYVVKASGCFPLHVIVEAAR